MFSPERKTAYKAAGACLSDGAAEAHAHGQRLFPAGTAALERFIQIICDAGQNARIFQQSKKREEDSHGRKHDGNHPRQRPVQSGDQQPVEPGRSVQLFKKQRQQILYGKQNPAQPVGKHVGAADGNPENNGQHEKHQGESGYPAGEDPVKGQILSPAGQDPGIRCIFSRPGSRFCMQALFPWGRPVTAGCMTDRFPSDLFRCGHKGADNVILPGDGARMVFCQLPAGQRYAMKKLRIPQEILTQLF